MAPTRGSSTLTISVTRTPFAAPIDATPSPRSCATPRTPGGSKVPQSPACIDPPCRVREGLYLGSADTETCWRALSRVGVTHVLQVGGELHPSHAERLSYHRLSLSDKEEEDLVGALGPAFAFIDDGRAAGAVLVHCAQGMSRSAAVIVAYLMARERLPYDAALGAVRAARPIVDPNEGFVLQLRAFERGACNLDTWAGWNSERLQRHLSRTSTSGRRVVHTFSDVIRRFHCHSLTDDDTVFYDDNTVLDV